MIRLSLSSSFGPFSRFDALEVPDLAILTGLNGSGKTQLLIAIRDGHVVASDGATAIDQREILYVGPELGPKMTLEYQLNKARAVEQQLITTLNEHREAFSQIGKRSRDKRSTHRNAQERLNQTASKLQALSQMLNVEPHELLEQEVAAYAVALSAESKVGHFGTDIARVSMGHLRTHFHQTQARYFSEESGDSSLARMLTPDLLVGGKVAPWELVTSVLQPFGFRLEGPELTLRSAQNDLRLVLRNNKDQDVLPSALSGGEQTLLALALAQYTTRAGGSFPKLLLLDESLSTLHPKIVNRALETIQNVFVSQNKTRVLLVTHSPTVIALAPERSLFEVSNTEPTLLARRIEPDVGLGLLTEGIPTLRIQIENQRQVLVESGQDQFVYSRVYQALASQLDPTISLQFIGCGSAKGEGGKARVTQLVKDFRAAGAKTIHGVIDWDCESIEGDGIHVLAVKERYAIENLLLDPLILALVLSRSEEGRAALGGKSQVALTSMEPSTLQKVVDMIVSNIAGATGRRLDPTTVAVRYVGGFELQVPQWVLLERGHSYAGLVMSAFPWLHRYRKGPNNEPTDKLVAGVAADCLVDIQDWIPETVLKTFRNIQQATAK